MANCKLVNLSKIYPSGELAFYDVNMQVNEREFIVITGEDGSGKSSLLRIIAGLDDASAGTIYVGDNVVNDVNSRDRDIAMIFQASSLYQQLTVFDNIGFGLKMRKCPAPIIEQKVKIVAKILGLTEVLYRKPKSLTTEQKQLVAIGRAIAREPKLYLFDDPIASLEASLKAKMLSVIINLQERMQGTFIYATKNVNEAMTMATRLVVLKDGFIQQIDTPQNVYEYPANAYCAFYVGSPTINFIRGAKLVSKEDGVYAEGDTISLKLTQKTISRLAEGYVDSDKTVIVGVRPEDCTLSDSGVKGVVTSFESGYTEVKVTDNTYLVATGTGKARDDKAFVQIDNSKLYLFDETTQLTILARDEGYNTTDSVDSSFIPLTIEEEKEIKAKLTPVKKNVKKKK